MWADCQALIVNSFSLSLLMNLFLTFSGFPLSQVSLAAVGTATSRSRAQAKEWVEMGQGASSSPSDIVTVEINTN